MDREIQDRFDDGQARQSPAWLKWASAAGVSLLLLAGVGAAAAMGGDFGGPGFGRHFGHGGFGGHGLSRMMDAIDATDEQEEKLWAIVDGTRAELRPMLREFRDTRETVAGLLGAQTIDRAAVETLRAERIAAIDQASRRMTAAIIDAAEVLTPEQRAELVKHFGEHRGRGRW